MKKALRILVPLLAVLTALPAYAQENPKKYRFEFFGGLNLPLNKDFEIGFPQSVPMIQGKHEFSPGGIGGVRFGIDGRRYWGQDYAYSYSAGFSRLTTAAGRFSITNHFHQASSNLLFYPASLDRRHFFPYLTAGAGATFVTVSRDTITEAVNSGFGSLKSETIFAFNAGAGVRFRLSDRVGLRLDARDYMSRALRYGRKVEALPVAGVFHQIAGTVGLVIHF